MHETLMSRRARSCTVPDPAMTRPDVVGPGMLEPGAPDPAVELATISVVAAAAVEHAAAALSEMALRMITAVSPTVRMVSLSDLSMVAGDPERPVLAVYLGILGDTRGHVLLAFSETMARALADLLLDQPAGTTADLGDLEISALAEAGNVAGSCFLTTLAVRAGLVLTPTPPVVVHEMRGAILDSLAADLAFRCHEHAMVIDAQFTCDGQVIEASFFMFPGDATAASLSGAPSREARS